MPAGSTETRANLPVQPPEDTRGGGSSFGQKPPEYPLGSPGFGEGTGANKKANLGAGEVVFDKSNGLPKPNFDCWPEIGFPPISGGEDPGTQHEWSDEDYKQWFSDVAPDLDDKILENLVQEVRRLKEDELPEEEIDRAWADFFAGEFGLDDDEWIERELPEVAGARRKMGAKEFTEWFLVWSAERRKRGKPNERGSKHRSANL